MGSKLQLLAPVLVLYGGYAVLYALCLYILFTRRKRARNGFLWQLFTTSTLFLLATLTVVSALIVFDDLTVSVHQQPPKELVKMSVVVPILAYVLADFVLIHRCYLIWEGRKVVILLPMLLLIATGVVGILSTTSSLLMGPFLSLSLSTNIIVSCLSAGRILWVRRKASEILSTEIRAKYNMSIHLILESGLFYSALLIVGVIFGELDLEYKSMLPGFGVVYLLSAQFSGIMPTLLIVWVGLGATSTEFEELLTSRINVDLEKGIPTRGALRGSVDKPLPPIVIDLTRETMEEVEVEKGRNMA